MALGCLGKVINNNGKVINNNDILKYHSVGLYRVFSPKQKKTFA